MCRGDHADAGSRQIRRWIRSKNAALAFRYSTMGFPSKQRLMPSYSEASVARNKPGELAPNVLVKSRRTHVPPFRFRRQPHGDCEHWLMNTFRSGFCTCRLPRVDAVQSGWRGHAHGAFTCGAGEPVLRCRYPVRRIRVGRFVSLLPSSRGRGPSAKRTAVTRRAWDACSAWGPASRPLTSTAA